MECLMRPYEVESMAYASNRHTFNAQTYILRLDVESTQLVHLIGRSIWKILRWPTKLDFMESSTHRWSQHQRVAENMVDTYVYYILNSNDYLTKFFCSYSVSSVLTFLVHIRTPNINLYIFYINLENSPLFFLGFVYPDYSVVSVGMS